MKEYFTVNSKHVFNLGNLVELDLSSNWFGIDGLYEVKDEFPQFQNLKSLKLGTNKLFLGDPTDKVSATKFSELLVNFANIEELDL